MAIDPFEAATKAGGKPGHYKLARDLANQPEESHAEFMMRLDTLGFGVERESEDIISELAKDRGLDPYEVCERAAILEHDAGYPQWAAEAIALGTMTHGEFHSMQEKKNA